MTNRPFSPQIKKQVENATVTLLGEHHVGKGVVIGGGLILTAAHCLELPLWQKLMSHRYDSQAPPADLFQRIETDFGEIRAAPLFIEIIADIAVLDYCIGDSAEVIFNLATTATLQLYKRNFTKAMDVFVWSSEKQWLTGDVRPHFGEGGLANIRFNSLPPSGTSGSPVVTKSGMILGVVSAPEAHQVDLVYRHLPAWLLERIYDG